MPFDALLAFTLTLLIAVALPGPGIIALVARALGSGFWPSVPMVLGMATGDLAFLTFAVGGLAVLAETLGTLFMAVKLAGGLWLMWLGWNLWRTRADGTFVTRTTAERPVALYLSGLTLTLGNPKVIAFYLGILPLVVDVRHVTLAGYFELAGIVAVILLAVLTAYAAAAARARLLLSSADAVRRLNRTAGGIMIGAGLTVAAS